jgi:hypothetical protein
MVTSATCGDFYAGGPRVRRPPVEWSAIAEISRNTDLGANTSSVSIVSDYRVDGRDSIPSRGKGLFL